MSKSIKLVTLVGDEEVVVGRCHPGQARILRKNGMAEWDKGRLILQGSSAPRRQGLLDMVMGLRAGESIEKDDSGYRLHQTNEGVIARNPEWSGVGHGYARALEIKDDSWLNEIDDIDPEGLLMAYPLSGAANKRGWRHESRPQPEEFVCATLVEWGSEVRKRLEARHLLLLADDPKRLRLGFVDDDENKVFYLGLRRLKEAEDGDFEQVGATQETFATEVGRRGFLGLQPETPLGGEAAVAIPELEALWIQDVEDTVGEEVRGQSQIRLAEEWNRLHTDESIRRMLGLKPREEFLQDYEQSRIDNPDWDAGRRSGLTTEAAIAATLRALKGEMTLVVGRDFFETVRDFVRRCDPACLVFVDLYARGKVGEIVGDKP